MFFFKIKNQIKTNYTNQNPYLTTFCVNLETSYRRNRGAKIATLFRYKTIFVTVF